MKSLIWADRTSTLTWSASVGPEYLDEGEQPVVMIASAETHLVGKVSAHFDGEQLMITADVDGEPSSPALVVVRASGGTVVGLILPDRQFEPSEVQALLHEIVGLLDRIFAGCTPVTLVGDQDPVKVNTRATFTGTAKDGDEGLTPNVQVLLGSVILLDAALTKTSKKLKYKVTPVDKHLNFKVTVKDIDNVDTGKMTAFAWGDDVNQAIESDPITIQK